jgi:acyl-CoA hydrolase
MALKSEYKKKLITAEEAAGLVKSHMWIDYGSILSFPLLIDEALARRAPELEKVKVRGCFALKEPEILKVDTEGKHFIYNEWHFSGVTRGFHGVGCCSYIPYNLGEGPVLYRTFLKDRVDIVFVEVSPMDEDGYFNFGTIEKSKAMCEAAKTVVVEVNESMPWVCGGYDHCIHISEVDYIVENDRYRVAELSRSQPTDEEKKIAENVAGLVEDESTIQIGIGGLPDEVGRLLIQKGLKDLGIHTEMFTESMMEMFEAGVVTNRKKTLHPDKAVCTFVLGSRKLYEFINHNSSVAGFPSDYTNNPQIIAQDRKQVAINSAVEVDLQGQVSSESHGYRHISGTGGQLEFVRGAYASPGGKAFICLPSTYRTRSGELRSRIVVSFPPGTIVTVPRTDVSYIATEMGVVNLKGKTVWERAKALISIAHPDFRDDLERQARKLNIIPKGV